MRMLAVTPSALLSLEMQSLAKGNPMKFNLILLLSLLLSLPCFGDATTTLAQRSTGDTITASFFNDITNALNGSFVGRDATSGAPTSGRALGTATYPWGDLRATTATITGTVTLASGSISSSAWDTGTSTFTSNGVAFTSKAPLDNPSFTGTVSAVTITGSGVLSTTDTTEASGAATASMKTSGGLGVAKNIYSAGSSVTVASNTAGPVSFYASNSNGTTAGHARALLEVSGASGGNPYVYHKIFGVSGGDWSSGVDNASSDNYEVCQGSDLSSNCFFTITTGGLFTLGTGSSNINRINGATETAAAATATLTNAPTNAAGNPDIWAKISWNGTTYVFPLWTP